jgi:DNA-binding HxlR family transcriptional regulator
VAMTTEPLRAALAQLGDRWTLVIAAALLHGPARFGDLQTAVYGIAPAVLSTRLKAMEAERLVVATPYQQRPVRLRYELTARGHELAPVIDVLRSWADPAHGPGHAACGTPLELAWWCPTCEVDVDPADEDLHQL